MGTNQSINVNVPDDFNQFTLIFCGKNKLRLLLAPDSIVSVTKNILNTAWLIRRLISGKGYVEFRLGRKPFDDSIKSGSDFKYLVCCLFKEYYSLGWHFQLSTQLQRHHCTSSTVIFEKKNAISTYVMCINLYLNRIRILGPIEVVNFVKTAIFAHWPEGMQNEKRIGQFFEIKLGQDRWLTFSPLASHSHFSASMMNNIMKTLFKQGWINIGAIKIGKNQADLNALYFRFDREIRDLYVSGLESKFCAISLNENDKIRLVNAPLEIANAVRLAIEANWSKGIDKEKIQHDAHEFEFTLKGSPFWCHGTDTVESRKIISGILKNLNDQSWSLYSTCLLSTSLSSKSVFFFQTSPYTNLQKCKVVCVSLNESDKLRVINGNSYNFMAVNNAIEFFLRNGVVKQNYYGSSWQFKLKRNLLRGSYADLNKTAAIIMSIIFHLKKVHCTLICSAFVSGKYSISDDDKCTCTQSLSSFYFSTNV